MAGGIGPDRRQIDRRRAGDPAFRVVRGRRVTGCPGANRRQVDRPRPGERGFEGIGLGTRGAGLRRLLLGLGCCAANDIRLHHLHGLQRHGFVGRPLVSPGRRIGLCGVETDLRAEIIGEGRVEPVPKGFVDGDDALGRVQPRRHRPLDVLGATQVHVVVDDRHHLERREGGESGEDRLFRPALALLGELDDAMIEAAAAMAHIDIGHAGHLLLQQLQNVGLAEQADRVPHLDAGQDGLEHRAGAPVDPADMDDRPRRDGGVIAGDLGERPFVGHLAGHDFAFQRPHGVGDHIVMAVRRLDQFERRAVKRTGNAEFVDIRRRGFGRRGRGEVQAGPDAAVEREGQGLSPGLRLLEIEFQMPTGVDIDVHPVLSDDLEALDRGVAHAGLRIFRDHHRGVEIGAAVLLGMDRDRHPGEIDIRLRHVQHRAGRHDHWIDRRLLPLADAVGNVLRQRPLLAPQQVGQQFARPVEAGQHRPFVAGDLLEQDGARLPFQLGGEAGQIVREIDTAGDAGQPTAAFQVLDDQCEIVNMGCRHRPAVPDAAAASLAQFRRPVLPAPCGASLDQPFLFRRIAAPVKNGKGAAGRPGGLFRPCGMPPCGRSGPVCRPRRPPPFRPSV